jgi:hypothetical protein
VVSISPILTDYNAGGKCFVANKASPSQEFAGRQEYGLFNLRSGKFIAMTMGACS